MKPPIYSKKAAKTISGIPNPEKLRIKKAIEKLPKGDVKQIHAHGVSTHRLRIGGWRVLFYFFDHETIAIEKIAPRGGVYKGE